MTAATGGLGRTFSRARWSAGRTDVRGWYEERRRQGSGRPAVQVATPPTTAPVPAPPPRATTPGTPREEAAREVLLAQAGPPHNLALAGHSVAEEIAQADNALLYYHPTDDTTRLMLAIGNYLVWVRRKAGGALDSSTAGPYVSPQHAQKQFDGEAALLERMAQQDAIEFYCVKCGSALHGANGVCPGCPGAP